VEGGLNRRKEHPMGIQSYRELEIWQASREVAAECYRVSRGFPKEERISMTSQVRRVAVAIPANIAKGLGRVHTKESLHHLSVASGPLMELETRLLLSQSIG
jgi:four helix bundle protein